MTNNETLQTIYPKTTLGKRAAKKLWKLLTVNPNNSFNNNNNNNSSAITNLSLFDNSSKICRDMTLMDTDLNDKSSTESNVSTKYSTTNSTVDSNSQKSSPCTLNEAVTLFPRNMPSIRRSRRRLQTNNNTTQHHSRDSSATKAVLNTIHKSAFARVTPTLSLHEPCRGEEISSKQSCKKTKMTPKRLKANCSKNRLKSSVATMSTNADTTTCSTLKKNPNKTSQKQLVNVKKAVVMTNTTTKTSSLTTTPLGKEYQQRKHQYIRDLSQQSSLLSYDLSCATSQQSLQPTQVVDITQNDNVKFKVGQNNTSDDTFLSSGISCPSETHSEASATNSPTFYQTSVTHKTIGEAFQYINDNNKTIIADDNKLSKEHDHSNHINNNKNIPDDEEDEEDALISLELAMINNGVHKYDVFNNTTNSTGNSTESLAVIDLYNLNKCRNRNALWLHATNNDPQLSDIEEQLNKIEMTTNTITTAASNTRTPQRIHGLRFSHKMDHKIPNQSLRTK